MEIMILGELAGETMRLGVDYTLNIAMAKEHASRKSSSFSLKL
jgi:hypothetical protein